jgi:tetratricopeptide (TPR) repeat protein
MRLFALSALLLVAAAPAGDNQRYQSCLAQVKSAPDKAMEMATGWRAEGGGVPAMHCQALALIEQGNAQRGAGVLDAAAQALGPQPKAKGFAGDIWAQAGNAWLLAGDSSRAISRLTTALGLLPDSGAARVNALVDRARAYADKTAWSDVIADLNTAAGLAPSNADVFLLRATAKRRSGDLGGAHTDILMAGSLAPDNIDVLVERGISNAQSQQIDAALADWRKVAALAPGSDQAKVAQGYLSQLAPLATKVTVAVPVSKPKAKPAVKPKPKP